MATVDPSLDASHLAAWGTSAVVVVTVGRSTSTALRSISRRIRSAGLELAYAILIGADRDDESAGLPDVLPQTRQEGAPTS